MSDLITAADEIGLELMGCKGDFRDICQLGEPFIVHLKVGHFILVTAATEDWVQVWDAGEVMVLKRKEFSKDKLSGLYLLPLKPDLYSRVVPKLLVAVESAPGIPPTKPVTIQITNPTDRDLEVTVASPSCSCLSGGQRLKLIPNQRVDLTLDLTGSTALARGKPLHLPVEIAGANQSMRTISVIPIPQ